MAWGLIDVTGDERMARVGGRFGMLKHSEKLWLVAVKLVIINSCYQLCQH